MDGNNQLFEELLGENASAIGSIDRKGGGNGGEESTAMSSVLGPILRAKAESPRQNLKGGVPGGLMHYHSGSDPTVHQLAHFDPQPQPRQDTPVENHLPDDNTDTDTLMTKPRVITFDNSTDDVSTFGGHGGVSGVESYLGNTVEKRRNRPPARRGGLVMYGGAAPSRHARAGYGRDGGTLESRGTTILEEIGLGSQPSARLKKEKGSVGSYNNYTDHYTNEYTKDYSEQRGRLRALRHTDAAIRRRQKRGARSSLLRSLLRLHTNRLLVLGVGVVFAIVQVARVRRRDLVGDPRYLAAGDVSDVRADAVQWQSEYRAPGTSAEQITGYIPLKKDVLRTRWEEGEQQMAAVRKGVPLEEPPLLQRYGPDRWEREGDQVLFDDGMTAHGDAGNHLRGSAMGNGRAEQPWYPSAQQAQQLREQLPQQQQQMVPAPLQQVLEPRPGPQQVQHWQNEMPPQQFDKLSDILPPQQQHPSFDLILPRFHVFADVRIPYVAGQDTPFFWHIPRSGGVVMKTMLSHCLGQVLAAEVGELNGHGDDTELKVVSFSKHNYTNVNIATPEGISRAANLGLVPSHLAHTLVSAHADLIPSLFNSNDRARAFVLFRHPVERAASMFYFLQGAGQPELRDMTVDDYAKSELIENNWLVLYRLIFTILVPILLFYAIVRILSDSMTGPIDMDNLQIAKEVLRTKFIVGLLNNKQGSFARFDHYFKWKDSPNYETEFGCRKQLMDEKYVVKWAPVRKDSNTWKLLLEQNRFDMHLYDFAKELFAQQSYIFGL